MRAPNPTFLKRADDIRSKRRLVTLILTVVLLVLILIISFVVWVGSGQSGYEDLYPDLVGRATDTTTTIDIAPSSATSSQETSAPETGTSETDLTSQGEDETSGSEEGGSETAASSVSPLEPDRLEIEDFHFSSSRSQVISHQRRAVLLDNMKNSIEVYIRGLSDMRVGFEYASLKNGEALGINELVPIVPGSTFALPVNIVASELASSTGRSQQQIITYTGHSYVNGSDISANYPANKQMYYGMITHLSIAYSDRVALEMLFHEIGGTESTIARINEISSFQPFDKEVFYTDFSGTDVKGAGRTTCYDMVNYLEYLYRGYMANPSCYQNILNSMAASEISSPLTSSFGENVPILHIFGRNESVHAYTELAIVDAGEPIAVCIYVEGENKTDVSVAFSTISGYVAEYINACY